MTAVANDAASGTSLLSRACDRCRSRKIRCDKISPCSNCRAADSDCLVSETPPQEPRQRVLISNQYERKIDAIESRLDGIENLLRSLVAKNTSITRNIASGSPASSSNASVESRHDENLDSKQFEGESSLSAHSKHARRTLESLLHAHSSVRYDPEVASALLSLQEMMHRQDDGLSRRTAVLGLQEGQDSINAEEDELPPFEDMLALLQNEQDTGSSLFFIWCPYIDVKQLTQLCQELYLQRHSCSLANEAIVSCGLFNICDEQSMLPDSPPKYRDYAAMLRKRFSGCFSRFTLLITPSFDNVLALMLGSMYAVATADYSRGLSLTCAAASMCQSLGWHRNVVVYEENQNHAEAKKLLFWIIYYFDKTLSLRLGRASILQDFDIVLDLPEIPSGSKAKVWPLYMTLLIEIAAIHGVIYEKLYSPRSSSQPAESRMKTVENLARRIQVALPQNRQIFERTTAFPEYMRLLRNSNEVVLHCLLTLTYRAAPSAFDNPFIFNENCLSAARDAIGAHLVSIQSIMPYQEETWAEYVNWTILICPFTPFMVLFCHVVSSCNTDDLKLLEQFATSINRPTNGTLEALVKFYQLCNAFFTLAKRYVAARLRSHETNQSTVKYTGMPNGDELDGVVPFEVFQDMDMQLSDLQEPLPTNGQHQDNPGRGQSDLSSQWYLSNTFDSWMAGDQQSLDFLGTDWSAFGTL